MKRAFKDQCCMYAPPLEALITRSLCRNFPWDLWQSCDANTVYQNALRRTKSRTTVAKAPHQTEDTPWGEQHLERFRLESESDDWQAPVSSQISRLLLGGVDFTRITSAMTRFPNEVPQSQTLLLPLFTAWVHRSINLSTFLSLSGILLCCTSRAYDKIMSTPKD